MASAMRWRKGVITILLGSGGNSPPPRLHLNAHARKHHAKKTAMAASEDQPSRSGLVQRCEAVADGSTIDHQLQSRWSRWRLTGLWHPKKQQFRSFESRQKNQASTQAHSQVKLSLI